MRDIEADISHSTKAKMEQQLNVLMSDFKANLQHNNQIEISSLKEQLAVMAEEHK